MKIVSSFLFATALATMGRGEEAVRISQYGITWTFDRPHTVGQFVNGDYWVLGPVKIVAVTPEPGPARAGEAETNVQSVYGATAMTPNRDWRNGSMIVSSPGTRQGYDSRLKNYDASLSLRFPLELKAGESLISTSSSDGRSAPVMLAKIMWPKEDKQIRALESGAILTCLREAPPQGAFRPPYAGAQKPIFLAKNLRWEILPSLAPPAHTPDYAEFARYLERPWLDHIASWTFQFTGPRQNQPNYGREFARVTSMASLMLMLDVPREKKERLMLGLIQFGIDSWGLANRGRNWSADGGHWNGRKWPILFAGLMLGDEGLQHPPASTLFSEDQQTYYGRGWAGQPALFQMVFHTNRISPYEEKHPDTWNAEDKKSEGYRTVVSNGLAGTALAVQLLGAKALWNHDAFFDYYDRWMAPGDAYAVARGGLTRPRAEGKSQDGFVDEMWAAYRRAAPAQPDGHDNRKWVWGEPTDDGRFISNPKAAADQAETVSHRR